MANEEIALEWSHTIHVSQALTIQADTQYIIHPNTDPTSNNALALIVRLELSLNWLK